MTQMAQSTSIRPVVRQGSAGVWFASLAKDAIRKAKFGVVVEGNLDVIASHQVGAVNVAPQPNGF